MLAKLTGNLKPNVELYSKSDSILGSTQAEWLSTIHGATYCPRAQDATQAMYDGVPGARCTRLSQEVSLNSESSSHSSIIPSYREISRTRLARNRAPTTIQPLQSRCMRCPTMVVTRIRSSLVPNIMSLHWPRIWALCFLMAPHWRAQ